MTFNEDDYKRIKARMESLREEVAKAEGAYAEIMKSLKEEFDCDDLNEAKRLLHQLESEEKKLTEEFNNQLNKFKEKWGDRLVKKGNSNL